jgi:long-chain acyl-CoA synthetase
MELAPRVGIEGARLVTPAEKTDGAPFVEADVPAILLGLPGRISDPVEKWAEILPDQPALVESSGVWTYAQLATAVAETRKWLGELGVRPGDRIMVVCENCRAYIAILLAAAGLNVWAALANARLSAREVDEIRDHCNPRRIFYTVNASPQAAAHARRHGAKIETRVAGVVGVGSRNETEPEPVAADNNVQTAVLIYTSGTTGVPKGVMLSHRNLLFVAAISAKLRSLGPDDRVYGVLPMSHAVGLSVVLLGTLLSGATLHLAARFDPVMALNALKSDELTILLGAPAMFALLIEYAKFKDLKSLCFSNLRIVSSSGAPLHLSLKSEVERLFGQVLHNGYGVTECSPNIASTRLEAPRNDESVGRVFPGIEVRLVGDDGEPVPGGEVGELWVRGPNVMQGYYRAHEETIAAINAEGWFNTRDLARLEDGNLFIVGRTKELIVRFGLNVYPAEVEAVLNAHPAVVRSAVVGRAVDEEQGGEELVAFVQQVAQGNLSATELERHSAQYLAPYKRPSHFVFVREMPVTPTGKVRKEELVIS